QQILKAINTVHDDLTQLNTNQSNLETLVAENTHTAINTNLPTDPYPNWQAILPSSVNLNLGNANTFSQGGLSKLKALPYSNQNMNPTLQNMQVALINQLMDQQSALSNLTAQQQNYFGQATSKGLIYANPVQSARLTNALLQYQSSLLLQLLREENLLAGIALFNSLNTKASTEATNGKKS
ncbi:MAG: hypothetical protein EBX40_03215, partial [Gammaproteobacteria bacterium]|nr:hypothetical protein [Gammaproteobacteria bacterium]